MSNKEYRRVRVTYDFIVPKDVLITKEELAAQGIHGIEQSPVIAASVEVVRIVSVIEKDSSKNQS